VGSRHCYFVHSIFATVMDDVSDARTVNTFLEVMVDTLWIDMK